jgi:hypothetical protein
MSRLKTWIIVAVSAVVVAVLIVVAGYNWLAIGTVGISVYGWIALILGAVVTLGVGMGLMALVFISSRRGYDDPP